MTTIVTTINANGIRAAVKERSERNLGLLPWLRDTDTDHVLLQETRATEEQTFDALAPALADGWHLCMSEAAIKGHSGVAILSRTEPDKVRRGFGSDEFDTTGRYLEADFGDLTVASLYLPKGAADGPKRDENSGSSTSSPHTSAPSRANVATSSSAATGTSRPPNWI